MVRFTEEEFSIREVVHGLWTQNLEEELHLGWKLKKKKKNSW